MYRRALYALSLGMGQDPIDEDELPYVYEGRGPLAVPSQCVTLCWPPFWHKEPETGIAWRRILHGEQSFSLFRPLPVEGEVRAEHRILAVDDKGPAAALSSIPPVTFSIMARENPSPRYAQRSFFVTTAARGRSGQQNRSRALWRRPTSPPPSATSARLHRRRCSIDRRAAII
jgi:hypothetical protein